MANNKTTPNLGIVNPTPQAEVGPEYAIDISGAIDIIDVHDHSSGKGVAITPAGINVDSDLPLNQNNLTTVRATRYVSQPSGLVGVGDVNETFVRGGDLCYINSAGSLIQLTLGSDVNVGTLSNMVLARQAVTNINWTILSSDTYILVDVNCSTTPLTVALPAVNSVTAGRWFVVADKTGSAAANNITIAAAGSDTIYGQSTLTLTQAYSSVVLIANGSNGWEAVGSVPGQRGATGIQGMTGPTGPQGPTGAAGGPPGPNGAQGIQGVQGPMGPGSPTAGPQGSAGVTGAQGIQGIQGPTGSIGTVGAQGATGVRGVTGATGPQGAPGATGSFSYSNDLYAGPTGPTIQSIGGYTLSAAPTGGAVDINTKMAINKSMDHARVIEQVESITTLGSAWTNLINYSLDDSIGGQTGTFQNVIAKIAAISTPSGSYYGRWTIENDYYRLRGVTSSFPTGTSPTVLGPGAPDSHTVLWGATMTASGATGSILVRGSSGVRWAGQVSRLRVGN